ncbi:hypothetical protein DL764_001118 [Monosporascus ibericus]|uniref:Uncharacterized protein n=1 Tax=Monosporascus ibericus TaxID=155417 RepID=A0A4Q4TSE8_9PEZI|nr:hypothetical protein DL764_001118 [Monosporascus ibericus]
MASVQMKHLTIVPKTGSEEKPAPSPTRSVDSGVNFDSLTSPGQTVPSRGFTHSLAAARGAREQTLESPISVIVNGYPVNASTITDMARELAKARANGEFPRTNTPGYIVQATIDDYGRLMELREARGGAPRSEWPNMRNATNLLINIIRDIRNRDELRGDQVEATTVEDRVANMMQGVHGEANLYRLVQHAVHHAIQNQAVQQDQAVGGVNMSAILGDIHSRLESQAAEGRHGVTESNMENVLEEVFGMIEHALIDASGPLRLNVNRMDNISDANQAQVNAISQHVNAIGGYVNAMGSQLNSMNGNVSSVAGNVQTLSSQLSVLQTIINMLPKMVTQAVQDILPQAAQEPIVPIIVASLQASMFSKKGGVSGKGADFDFDEKHANNEKSPGQHKKKPNFFKRFFGSSKRGSQDDHAGASGLCF